MFTAKEKLKQLASDYFVDGLSHVVAEQIEKDATKAASRLPSAINNEGMVPYSAATLFLGDKFYKGLKTGRFSGRVLVAWNGMDDFIFAPDEQHKFSYVTSDNRTITPRVMSTDGGSIPRILRGLKKYSSWGYAPAFIIHDWLFTAKKCQHQPDVDWTFPQSAMIMAEAMKTLMEVGYQNYEGEIVKLEKAEDTLYLMYQAVNSFIAKDLWDADDSTHCMV